MDLHLSGKHVLITGGSRGIGLAAAETFAEEGCHIQLAARDKIKLEEAACRIRETYDAQVETHAVDLSQTCDVEHLADGSGEIDILINNAGDIPALGLMNGLAKSRFGDESRFTEFTARFPLGRAASPKEVGDAMAFLASDRSAYTSGVIYTIDGGICARGF